MAVLPCRLTNYHYCGDLLLWLLDVSAAHITVCVTNSKNAEDVEMLARGRRSALAFTRVFLPSWTFLFYFIPCSTPSSDRIMSRTAQAHTQRRHCWPVTSTFCYFSHERWVMRWAHVDEIPPSSYEYVGSWMEQWVIERHHPHIQDSSHCHCH